MTDFSTADLRNFMVSYQDIPQEHDAVMAFWDDLLQASSSMQLDGDARAALEALLPEGCALAKVQAGLPSPFGTIVHRPMTEEGGNPGFIAPEFSMIEVAGRLFSVGYTDSGLLDFSGDQIQEVVEKHSRRLKMVPRHDGVRVGAYPEVEFTAGIADGADPLAVSNLAAMMSAGTLSPLWDRPLAGAEAPSAVLDPEGRPVRYLGGGGLNSESGAWVEISYLKTTFLLRLDWSSYGGVCVGGNSEAVQARSAMVANTEYALVGEPVEIVSFDHGPLRYLMDEFVQAVTEEQD